MAYKAGDRVICKWLDGTARTCLSANRSGQKFPPYPPAHPLRVASFAFDFPTRHPPRAHVFTDTIATIRVVGMHHRLACRVRARIRRCSPSPCETIAPSNGYLCRAQPQPRCGADTAEVVEERTRKGTDATEYYVHYIDCA